MAGRRSLFAIALLAVVIAGCPGGKPPAAAPAPGGNAGEGPVVWKMSKTGLGFRLSNADDEADAPPEKKIAPTTALGAADARKIALRLPEIKRDPDDAKDFALRAKSIPAPRPGKTVTEAFPPPEGAPPANAAASGPLKVERHAPEGDVELAPYLTMTFSQPMVAVTSIDEIAKDKLPAHLTPEPAGKWRWLGTKTLMFQPEKRFPMATDYVVEIPAGTKSMAGGVLAAPMRWTFSTPAPTMKRGVPRDASSVVLDPFVMMEFDQAIDPKAVLGTLELKGPRGAVPIRLAEPDEIEGDEPARRQVQQAEKGRFIVVRPAEKLTTMTSYSVRIKTGTRSAEGPKTTTAEQGYAFYTYGPMSIVSHMCSGWVNGKETCPPLTPFTLAFSNPIEAKKFDAKMITVSPEIPQMKVESHGNAVVIRGKTKGRTKYTVTTSGTIPDVHQQTMGVDASVTFDVGSAEPAMFDATEPMAVLDPGEKARQYQVYSINEPGLHARVYTVRPEDWAQYVEFSNEWIRPRKIQPPGKLVFDKVITTKKAPDELVATPIDLSSALSGGVGQALVVVEPTRAPPKGRYRPELHVWVQSTEMGLDAMVENDRAFGWATRLADGAPLEGVDVQILGGPSGKTGADGMARFGLDQKPGHLVYARKGKDVVIVPQGWYGQPSYVLNDRPNAVKWFVYDDRGMYKPGEEMRVKGFLRSASMVRGGDLASIPDIGKASLGYRVLDPRYAEIGTGKATLDEYGGFDFAYKLPGNANLGNAHIELKLEGSPSVVGTTSNHAFQIQEFRRPEFEVSARASEGPHLVGKHAVTTLSASYYSGGGLPDAPVRWNVTSNPTSFTPPNRSDYHFGPEPSYFWSWRPPRDDENKSEIWTAKTNGQGLHRLRLDFDAVEPSYPLSIALSGTVEDVNRQQWAGNTTIILHPSNEYVGIKLAKSFIHAGENIELDAVLVDIDGKALPKRHATVKAARVDWEQKNGDWVEQRVEEQTCETDDKLHCSFKTKEGGSWRVTAVIVDELGRKNQTATSLWVVGGAQPKDRSLERARANVLLDKKSYQPGETAEVLVVAPFAPAYGLLTVRRQGVVDVQRFAMKTTSQTLHVKIDESLVPNAEVRVDLLGQDLRADASGSPSDGLPKRPAFATGSTEAQILPTSRKLDVTATAKRPTLEPGGTTQIDVDVKDSAGRGVGDAEVALVVADEAVLALSGYKTPDPMAVFYASRSSDVHDLGMREHVLLGDPDLTKLRQSTAQNDVTVSHSMGYARAAPMAEAAASAPPPAKPMRIAAGKFKDADEDHDGIPDALDSLDKKKDEKQRDDRSGSVVGKTKTPMQVRSDFSALALFSPAVKTDARGHATVPIKLPDNLTRYRVMAIAARREKQFGSGESTITAKLPVMARPSAPRFLNFGDKFELPIVIQNQTDQPIEVGVVVRATNATVAEPSAKRVKIAPNDRAEVRFGAATVKPGTARFQFGIASGEFSDASQIELPVWTPATTEAFATYGEIDEGAMAQPVKMPPNVFSQFGGLEITTSSTQLQALTDAVVYLYKYPFECNEQVASRVISIAALRDVLSAFKSKDLPEPAAIEASMKNDFEKLKRTQNYSGGWGFWQEEPWPYLSIHVAHALIRAKDKGYKPDEQMLARSLAYLRTIESHIPAWYLPEARRAIVAYSLYVRNRMKDPDPAKAKKLIGEVGGVDKLPIEAIGWIWPTISGDPGSRAENEAIRLHVANRVTETAGNAHFVSGYKDSDWVLLNSDRRADGVLLEALIGDQKDSTIIPKLVKGLLAHRTAGRWLNTQENAFILLALDRYFGTYEKVTPDFVARVWLGDRFAGEHAFKGRTTEYADVGIPMQFLAAEKQKEQDLVIGKDGPGRLYYRVGMQYAPTDLKLPPADHGFVVSRLYEGADKPEDVRRDPDGTWRVKAGTKVRVRVSMVAPSRRYHVALVDPIPAGLEPMNPALAVTGEIPKDPKANASNKNPYWYWARTWYEHQNMRDERVEAFASLLWEGVWDYTYVARATTPGTFVVPPAKAEEMYAPETFGRSAGDRMIVE